VKVLHFVHNFPPEFLGGTEAYLVALVREQRRSGIAPSIVSGSEVAGPEPLRERFEGCDVLRLRLDPATERYGVRHEFDRLAAAIVAELDRVKPDVVHVHHWFHLAAGIARLAKARGCRVIVSLHDYFAICPRFFLIRTDGFFCGDRLPVEPDRCIACVRDDVRQGDAAIAEQFAARHAFFAAELAAADHRLAPSRVAADLVTRSGILPVVPPIEVLPLGLLDPFDAPPDARPKASGSDLLRLVFFGNVAPVKGVDDLLAAVLALPAESRARLRILLLGKATDGALEDRIRAASQAVEIVREPAYDRPRLQRLRFEADVAVFPSRAAETYSLVVDEALALGLPLIVTHRGAMGERAGAAAIVVPAGDVESLRRAIESLFDADRRAELAAAAAAQTFTIADHAARLSAIYRGGSQRAE
jgi:glycosyltransferase involved in cell wall biosynthesis